MDANSISTSAFSFVEPLTLLRLVYCGRRAVGTKKQHLTRLRNNILHG